MRNKVADGDRIGTRGAASDRSGLHGDPNVALQRWTRPSGIAVRFVPSLAALRPTLTEYENQSASISQGSVGHLSGRSSQQLDGFARSRRWLTERSSPSTHKATLPSRHCNNETHINRCRLAFESCM
jgi:hypothetical protein